MQHPKLLPLRSTTAVPSAINMTDEGYLRVGGEQNEPYSIMPRPINLHTTSIISDTSTHTLRSSSANVVKEIDWVSRVPPKHQQTDSLQPRSASQEM